MNNTYIDWDNQSPEEYENENEFKKRLHITPTCECHTDTAPLQLLKQSLDDLHKPFAGYIDTDEADERERAQNEKYYWDAAHGLI